MEALLNLWQDETIVIKQADKGGALVIQNKTDYVAECLQQLEDERYYKAVSRRTLNATYRSLATFLTQLGERQLLDEETAKNLIVKHPRLAVFYTNPKIHKEGNPGRPIVSSINSATSKMSIYIDDTYKVKLPEIASYLKDTTHLRQILKSIQVRDGDIMFSLDMAALYSNIPHADGITAMGEFAENHGINHPSTQVLKELIMMVLTNNYFEFNNQVYKQVKGTALGTHMAPTYTNIYMDWLERDLLKRYPGNKPLLWKRFIDDIFGIWRGKEEELLHFFDWINHQPRHSTIIFTPEYSTERINFLDVSIYKQSGNPNIQTRLYSKPTGRASYLHFSSSHPYNQKKSIPYSQLLRVRRICSEGHQFHFHARKMIQNFRSRGY